MAGKKQVEQDKSTGIGNCSWLSNGEQCKYPGTISHNTQGMGPWYCRFHARSGINSAYGEQVVYESRQYQHQTLQERDRAHIARLRDPSYKPKFRACEELRCIKSGSLQPNGRYLCATHKDGEIEYAKKGPKGRVGERIVAREPGEDLEEAA